MLNRLCLLLGLVALSLGATTHKVFLADFSLFSPSRPTKGTMKGRIYYYSVDEVMIKRIDYDNNVKEYYDYQNEIMYRYNGTNCSSYHLKAKPDVLYGETQKDNVECTLVAGEDNVKSLCIVGSTVKNITFVDDWHMTFGGYTKLEVDDPVFKKPEWNCQEKRCYTAMNLVLVLDASGSTSEDWPVMKQFARNVTARFEIGESYTEIAIVTFGSSGNLVANLQSDRLALYTLLTTMSSTGEWTCIGCGINLAGEVLRNSSRVGVDNVLIVVTDGQNNQPRDEHRAHLLASIENLALLEPKIFAVGVGNEVLEEEMKIIQSENIGDRSYFHVADFQHLSEVLDDLTSAACFADRLDECPCEGFCGVDNQCLCPSSCRSIDNKCNVEYGCGAPNYACYYQTDPCNDDDGCTKDSCDPKIGCVHEDIACPTGMTCISKSDGNSYACSVVDKSYCDFDGDCPTEIDKCLVARCDVGIHKCTTDSKSCDDQDSCTTDYCDEGFCLHDMITCDDKNECTEDYCDHITKKCVHIDMCEGDKCHIGTCNPATGCKLEPIVCARPEKDPECFVTECTLEDGCVSTFIKNARKADGSKCESDWTVALIAILTSIGFIIAVILIFLAIFGICLYRRAKRLAKREQFSRLDSVKDNELYEAAGGGGANPLFEGSR